MARLRARCSGAGSEERRIDAEVPFGDRTGNVEPRLKPHAICAADPTKEVPVRGAAPEEDVLAVVVPEATPASRRRESSEGTAALEEHDVGSLVRDRDPGCDPCESPSDHPDGRPRHG